MAKLGPKDRRSKKEAKEWQKGGKTKIHAIQLAFENKENKS